MRQVGAMVPGLYPRDLLKQALKGDIGAAQRFSNTLDQDLMYVAIPLYRENQLRGVLRTSLPITFI